MADRVVEGPMDEAPEIPELVEKVILYTLEEAKQKLSQGSELVPFTALAVKDNLFVETHPGETVEQCFNAARHTVQNAAGASAYALCYDGYVELDDETRDAIISEGGQPGDDTAYAVGFLYTQTDDGFEFDDTPAYIGPAPNFMVALSRASSADSEK